ncbi:hypothetical protein ACJZ2D_013559 [Fusarium nematophilum]
MSLSPPPDKTPLESFKKINRKIDRHLVSLLERQVNIFSKRREVLERGDEHMHRQLDFGVTLTCQELEWVMSLYNEMRELRVKLFPGVDWERGEG